MPVVSVAGELLGGVGAAAQGLGERAFDAARVARFLRGRLEFSPRKSDIFVSSYPRSGTTWLQQILLVLSQDGDPATEHIAQTVPWFERSLSLGQRRARDFEPLADPRVFKSHLPFQWLPPGARYIYAERDGRDVAVSYFHLYRSHLGYRDDFDAFLEIFLRGDLQYRSWFKHVAGWRELADRPDVLVVRYEDMLDDLAVVMNRLNDFCRFGRSRERVEQLTRYCTFTYMKSHEARFDHATAEPGKKQERAARGGFVRRGQRGGYREYFSQPQLEAFERARGARRPRPGLEFDLPAFLH